MRLEAPGGSANQELARFLEPHWYAVYTCAHHERRVADQFINRGVEHFLPHYESVRKWKDRRVRLQLPLFPGYVFVHLALQNRLQVLQVPGVVKLVGFNGQPAPLPETEIGTIRNALNSAHHIEPHAYIQVGRRVRVLSGPLEGLAGIVVKRKNRTRLIISLELIQRSVSVEVSDMDLLVVAQEAMNTRPTVSHA
jgi:transcription antitermination factor NusG